MNISNNIFLKDQNSAFTWFIEFEAKSHLKLRGYRHPLTHFNISNYIQKGNIYSGIDIIWPKISSDRSKIMKSQEDFRSKGDFLTEQFHNCRIGIEKTIDLIQEIP